MLKSINKIEEFLTSRVTFILFSSGFILYIFIGLVLLYSPGGCDYWEHLATIYHLSSSPTDTSNAYVLLSKPFFLNTPYHLFWGIVSKVFKIHPFWLLPLIGVINHTIFLTATVYLSKYLTNSRKYALITALTLLFFWYNPWQWSGFYHFGMLPLASIYPYWFALPLSLIIISKIGIKKGFHHLIIYVIAMSFVFLIHPLTGSFLFLGVFIKGLTSYQESLKNRIFVILTPLLAFLLSMLWSYFSVGDEIFKISEYRYFLGLYWQWYVQPWKTLLPAFFGLLYIPIAIKYKQFNFVTIGLFAATAIFVVNRFTFHNQYLSRYLIYICFFLQVSIVLLLKNAKHGLPRKLTFLVYAILLIIFGGKQIYLSSSYLGIIKDIKNDTPIGTHLNINYYNSYKKIGDFVSATDVVFAPVAESWLLPGIAGCHVVNSPHAEVFDTDEEFRMRWNDADIFYTDSTSIKIREELIRKYNVQFVMVPKEFNYTVFDSITILGIVYNDPNYRFYKVKKN